MAEISLIAALAIMSQEPAKGTTLTCLPTYVMLEKFNIGIELFGERLVKQAWAAN